MTVADQADRLARTKALLADLIGFATITARSNLELIG